ncbi:MAG: tRNA glutamyl-Q(34) synthetase GluQRS [Proteobacteria bacterium]|nr:MAG: tRNA glutamyl-Q(34) synthetase GluQRS [Pseudomonadota bacterium]
MPSEMGTYMKGHKLLEMVLEAYQEALETLQDFCYPCTCSRKQLNLVAEHGLYGLIYPGTCRNKPPHPPPLGATAIRLRVPHETICFQDAVQGLFCQNLAQTLGDFIIRRADGLYAYQLAVVVDDAWQNISHIIRGADLLDNTPRQMYLQTLLGLPQPQYLHIPIATYTDGQKLSKQTKAAPIPTENKAEKLKTLCATLQFLGQTPPHFDNFSSLADCWQWALTHWNSRRIPAQRQLEQTP